MWRQIINTLTGIWLMAAPSVMDYTSKPATDNDHIIGPLIATFAIIAYWEATRSVGKWNVILGLWLVLAPWILSYNDPGASINDVIGGVIVIICSLKRGKLELNFGGGWASLFQKDPEHLRAAKERDQK